MKFMKLPSRGVFLMSVNLLLEIGVTDAGSNFYVDRAEAAAAGGEGLVK